ncbi:MAG: hypothetical protein Q4D42_12635, partial [Eubacteriales bacterium]|nr:hypothetical protein [Eubacteriales bacterium]
LCLASIDRNTTIDVLDWFCRYWFYFCAVLTVAAYICLSSSLLEDVDEAIAGCKNHGYYQRNVLKHLLAVFVVGQAILFLLLELTAMRRDTTGYTASVLPKMYVCNLLLPLFICLLVACVLAQWQNQHRSGIALVVFLVMSSPVTELLFGDGQNADAVGNRLGYAIRHSFDIFYCETFWSPNVQVGLQTEWTRFAVQFFWVLLCLGLLLWATGRRRVRVPGCLLLACGVACLVYAQLPASTYRHYNNHIDQYLYRDEVTSLQKETDFGYTIADYDLTLDFGRQLDVTGTLAFQADEPTKEFVFTLYRGYTVESLESAQPLAWSVQDDVVTIQTESPTQDLQIALHYAGYNHFLYSNMDGATLPGWFPWYPMAGERQIYWQEEGWTAQYNTLNRIEPANIRLTVQSPFALVSNLEQTSEQVYEGTSDSITIIGGYITKTDDPVVMDTLPLGYNLTEEQCVEMAKKDYQELCNAMDAYGIDKTLVSDRKLILTSYDLESNSAGGGVAIFSDYILATYGTLYFGSFSSKLILEHSYSEQAAFIGSVGLEETPEDTLERWLFFLEDPEDLSDGERYMLDIIDAAKKAGTEEQLVRDIAAFLISEHDEADEETFWKELGERYGTV